MYTKKQVLYKTQEALKFLFDSQGSSNFRIEMNNFIGAIQCLGAAHNMLAEIYDKEMKKEIESYQEIKGVGKV